MKKFAVMIMCLSLTTLSKAQNVEIIKKSEQSFDKRKSSEPFHFIEPAMDTTLLTFIATLKVSSPHYPSADALFAYMKSEGKRLGANAFKVRHYDDSLKTVIVNVYLASGRAIESNMTVKPRNIIYVLAGESENEAYHHFELNGTGKSVKSGNFFSYALKEGERVKLRKGNITGTMMWIKWSPNQLPKYYSIYGLHKEPVVKRTTVSKAEKPGKFHSIDADLGAFLVTIFGKKSKIEPTTE